MEDEKMATYKEAYEGLASLVKVSGNESLNEAQGEIDEIMVTNHKKNEAQAIKTPKISKEEFEGMSYKERLTLSNEHKELYDELAGGK